MPSRTNPDPAARGATHSLRKTAINDAIRNGATMHEVREFAGHADIHTTELYFVRKEEDAEVAARRIQVRGVSSNGTENRRRVSQPSAHLLAVSSEPNSRTDSGAHAITAPLPWPDTGEPSAG